MNPDDFVFKCAICHNNFDAFIPCLNHLKEKHFLEFKQYAREQIIIGDGKRQFEDLYAAAQRAEESKEVAKTFKTIGPWSRSDVRNYIKNKRPVQKNLRQMSLKRITELCKKQDDLIPSPVATTSAIPLGVISNIEKFLPKISTIQNPNPQTTPRQYGLLTVQSSDAFQNGNDLNYSNGRASQVIHNVHQFPANVKPQGTPIHYPNLPAPNVAAAAKIQHIIETSQAPVESCLRVLNSQSVIYDSNVRTDSNPTEGNVYIQVS